MAARITRATLSEKEKVIYDTYYNPKTGFRSMPATYKAVHDKDASITRDDVKSFLKKQAVVQDQSQKGIKYNSFVSHEAREEYQVDLADFGQRQEPRYGLISVDIFSKKLAVVPIQNKLPQTTATAFQKVIDEMDIPASIMTDEGGEWGREFAAKLDYYDIDHLQSRTHPRFVERVIRTLKEGIEKRLMASGRKSWSAVYEDVVDQYNGIKHSITGVEPNVAADETSAGHEKLRAAIVDRLEQHRIGAKKITGGEFAQQYPDLNTEDQVRVRAKVNAHDKGPQTRFEENIYKIKDKKNTPAGTLYKVSRYRGDGEWHLENRWFLRHELLKISDQQLPEIEHQEPEYDAKERRLRVSLAGAAQILYDHLKVFPSLSIGPVGAYLGKEKLLPIIRKEAGKVLTFLKLFPEKFEMQDGNTRVAPVAA